MPIQVYVYYWNEGNFGHISIKVCDLSSQDSRYISFAYGTDASEKDEKQFGITPNIIKLPQIGRTFASFLQKFEASPYYLNPQAASDVSNTKYYQDIPTKSLKEYRKYCSHYGFLSSNCAHAVENILYLAGYLKNPSKHAYGLRPYAITQKICSFSLRLLDRDRKGVESLNISNLDKSQKILTILLDRLAIKKTSHEISYFTASKAQQIESDVNLLKIIKIPSATIDLGFVEGLFSIKKQLQDQEAIAQIETILRLMPAELLRQANDKSMVVSAKLKPGFFGSSNKETLKTAEKSPEIAGHMCKDHPQAISLSKKVFG